MSFSFNLNEKELLIDKIEDLDTNQALLLNAIHSLSTDPSNSDSYILGLSQIVYELIKVDQLELALHFDRKLIDENSFFEKPNLYAASIFIQLNSPEHALPHIERCLKYNPESIPCHILLIEHHYNKSDRVQLDRDVPLLLDLMASNSQDQVFALLAIFDENKDYAYVLKYADEILRLAPNYYREIDFMAMKAAFLNNDIEALKKYSAEVAEFEVVLTASERALYLSSMNYLYLLEGNELVSQQIQILSNIDTNSIYPQLLLRAYYKANNNTQDMQKAQIRALEIDFDNMIPPYYFETIDLE